MCVYLTLLKEYVYLVSWFGFRVLLGLHGNWGYTFILIYSSLLHLHRLAHIHTVNDKFKQEKSFTAYWISFKCKENIRGCRFICIEGRQRFIGKTFSFHRKSTKLYLLSFTIYMQANNIIIYYACLHAWYHY